MKANASDYYKWPEESSIVSGTCYNGSLLTEIVVTNKKIILKNQQAVQIIYLSSVSCVKLIESRYIHIYYSGEKSLNIDLYNNASWSDQLFEGINDAISKLK